MYDYNLFLIEYKLTRNQLIKTFPTYHEQFYLSIDVKPLGVVSGWGSIIHVTKGGDENEFGNRIPAIWFHPGTKRLHICTAIGSSSRHCHDEKVDLPTHRFTNIQISQAVLSGADIFWYSIAIDKKTVFAVENPNPLYLSNVKVFMANPWHISANALVKNVQVTTSQGG